MKPDMYRHLYGMLEEKGIILINSPEEYEKYHLLPGWYEDFKEETAESVWIEDIELSKVLEQAKLHPEFVPFGTVHPDEPNLPERAETLFRAGHIGIKLHPDMQQTDIDDPRLLPLYDTMQGRMPLYLHAGDPRHPYSHPEKIRKIMRLFPRLTVVAAHLGSWSMQDTALPLLGKMENCIVDTSSAMSFMPMEKAVRIMRAYGADRVFFGTDYPVGNVFQERETFDRLPLTDDEKERIGFLNAERFFAAYNRADKGEAK